MNVSILISVFNGVSDIDTCFDSIFNQSFKDFDIVCIDDHSTDESVKKIKTWSKRFKYFRLIENKKNVGLTRSLNIGLKHCRGKYIARIDSDDFWLPEKLKLQIEFVEKNPDHGFIGCNYVNHNLVNKRKYRIKLPKTDLEIRKNAFRRNPFAHSCILIRRDLIRKVGGYTPTIRYGQDYDLFFKCFPYTKFHNIQMFLCERLIKNESISIHKQRLQAEQSIKTKLKYIRKYRPGFHNYRHLIEPYLNKVTPEFIKNLKRKLI